MDKENAATNVRRRSGSSASGRQNPHQQEEKRRPDVKLQEPGVKLPEVLI